MNNTWLSAAVIVTHPPQVSKWHTLSYSCPGVSKPVGLSCMHGNTNVLLERRECVKPATLFGSVLMLLEYITKSLLEYITKSHIYIYIYIYIMLYFIYLCSYFSSLFITMGLFHGMHGSTIVARARPFWTMDTRVGHRETSYSPRRYGSNTKNTEKHCVDPHGRTSHAHPQNLACAGTRI